MNWGIQRDNEHAAAIPEEERCDCCHGTGNMLLSMYMRCLACHGDGRTRGKAAEIAAEAKFNELFPPRVPTTVVDVPAQSEEASRE